MLRGILSFVSSLSRTAADQYWAFWNIIGACAEAIPSSGMVCSPLLSDSPVTIQSSVPDENSMERSRVGA
jgi:hypothetical protein